MSVSPNHAKGNSYESQDASTGHVPEVLAEDDDHTKTSEDGSNEQEKYLGDAELEAKAKTSVESEVQGQGLSKAMDHAVEESPVVDAPKARSESSDLLERLYLAQPL